MMPLYATQFKGSGFYDEKPTDRGVSVNTVAILSKEGMKVSYTNTGSLTAACNSLFRNVRIAYLG